MDDLYGQMIEALQGRKRVLVTTHVRPDGDALGSAAAMVLGLRTKGIDSEVLLLSPLPRKYAFIFKEDGIVHHDVDKGWPAHFGFAGYDALLVVDTGTLSQLSGLDERMAQWPSPRLVIDHHLTQENWAQVKLVETQAAAAGEIVADLLRRWGVTLDHRLATALYLAIASDTGWFQFANTRPKTLRLAADLMEAGVDTDGMYQLLFQNESPHRVALQTRAMQSLELLADGRLAVMSLRASDFAQTHAHVPDTENLINIPLQIAMVEVSVLVTEPPEGGPIRVSLRSKGRLDMAKFAEGFGGGGHARAAGLKLSAAFQEAHDKVVAAMVEKMTG